MVDMDRIFAALRTAGYDGWIIVEQEAPANPVYSAKRSRAFLRKKFGV